MFWGGSELVLPGKVKGGREAPWGDTMLADVGLVGEAKLWAKDGGELVHCSMCSGFIVGLGGLGGRGFDDRVAWEVTEGEEEERFVDVLVSLGVAASVALDCGLRAVLLPPGEFAVAVLPSEVL